MDRRTFVAGSLAAALPANPLLAQSNGQPMKPPVARRGTHRFKLHGITLEDPYAWIRDKGYPKVEDPEVLAYLKAENAYFEDRMRAQSMLVEALYEQMKGRIKEDDASVPYADGDWMYWWAFETGGQYRNWYRKPRGTADGDRSADQLLLSEPKLAEGKEYFRLGTLDVSPDGKLMAYSTDTDGSERYVLVVQDIASGQVLETVAKDSLGQVVWQADSKALVWAQASAEWRPTKIWLHRLGASRGTESELLYEEKEAGFWVQPSLTQDRRRILLNSYTQTTNEVRMLDAADPSRPAVLIRPRKTDVRYSVDARADTLFVLTNDDHVNFRIATAPVSAPGDWTTLIAGSNDVYLTDMTAFASFLAIEERMQGLEQIRILWPDGRDQRVKFPEASYTASLGTNAEPDTKALRINYSSMITPATVFDYQLPFQTLVTKKVQEIPSGYDPSQYATERLMAPARDGTRVPVSVVYRKDYVKDGSKPLHVYGYGSYGIATPPSFSAARLSLLDRGFAYAIVHTRGGDDQGYQWYLDGKLEKRENTFNDFVDGTRYLNKQGFGRHGFNSASGGSAGGWLMGAVVNQAPDMWKAIVAHVPFVDIVNTMVDDTLPLTPGEWPEWGDPRHDEVVLKRLIRLSPYDQTVPMNYPAMMITGGLSDPRVTYWEPAKWAARIRAVKTDNNVLLLKINMGAGHGGKSGRFDRLREQAEEFAFILATFDGQMKA
jgi:oligopeptidase B